MQENEIRHRRVLPVNKWKVIFKGTQFANFHIQTSEDDIKVIKDAAKSIYSTKDKLGEKLKNTNNENLLHIKYGTEY